LDSFLFAILSCVLFIDFMYHFSQWGFQSVAEAVDTIVFNPNFIFELEYSKGF
jgi:hypothetical protein